jgi:predicted nucleotidyltransferase
VANALRDMRQEVVFVGGATIGLYGDEKTSPESRPTEDVDCIIELASYGDFTELEERLRSRGFQNDLESNVQIRWRWQEYTVDIMPTNERILGFSNLWYKTGMQTAMEYNLPDASTIRILDPPHLLGTKFCAMKDRGEDLRYDSDFEDILYVLTYRPQVVEEVVGSLPELRAYLAAAAAELVGRKDIRAILDAAKDRDITVEILLNRLRQLV